MLMIALLVLSGVRLAWSWRASEGFQPPPKVASDF
jgi:hypothetical protein